MIESFVIPLTDYVINFLFFFIATYFIIGFLSLIFGIQFEKITGLIIKLSKANKIMVIIILFFLYVSCDLLYLSTDVKYLSSGLESIKLFTYTPVLNNDEANLGRYYHERAFIKYQILSKNFNSKYDCFSPYNFSSDGDYKIPKKCQRTKKYNSIIQDVDKDFTQSILYNNVDSIIYVEFLTLYGDSDKAENIINNLLNTKKNEPLLYYYRAILRLNKIENYPIFANYYSYNPNKNSNYENIKRDFYSIRENIYKDFDKYINLTSSNKNYKSIYLNYLEYAELKDMLDDKANSLDQYKTAYVFCNAHEKETRWINVLSSEAQSKLKNISDSEDYFLSITNEKKQVNKPDWYKDNTNHCSSDIKYEVTRLSRMLN